MVAKRQRYVSMSDREHHGVVGAGRARGYVVVEPERLVVQVIPFVTDPEPDPPLFLSRAGIGELHLHLGIIEARLWRLDPRSGLRNDLIRELGRGQVLLCDLLRLGWEVLVDGHGADRALDRARGEVAAPGVDGPRSPLPAPVTVRQVGLTDTASLRSAVLRRGVPMGPAQWSALDVVGAATFAAFAPQVDDPVGTVTVMPAPCPWRPDHADAWQLRGMATADGWRDQGVGAATVAAAVDHVAGQGASLLWCNARVAARTFYERAGFTVDGEVFDVAGIGPHLPMARPIT